MSLALADSRIYAKWDAWNGLSFEYESGPPAWRVGLQNVGQVDGLSFSLRRFVLTWRLGAAGAEQDDARTMSLHLLKVDDDEPGEWTPQDFSGVDALVSAFWSALVGFYSADLRLREIAAFRAGPRFDTPNTPGPPVYRAAKNAPGTIASNQQNLPQQVACVVTERTASRSRWGRFYLPSPSSSIMGLGGVGRFGSGYITAVANAAQSLYQGCLDNGAVPVVYSKALPHRMKKNGQMLPARDASAAKVQTLQVDDVPDVIRSRRIKTVAQRERRGAAVL
jgi:hypothetical protein